RPVHGRGHRDAGDPPGGAVPRAEPLAAGGFDVYHQGKAEVRGAAPSGVDGRAAGGRKTAAGAAATGGCRRAGPTKPGKRLGLFTPVTLSALPVPGGLNVVADHADGV